MLLFGLATFSLVFAEAAAEKPLFGNMQMHSPDLTYISKYVKDHHQAEGVQGRNLRDLVKPQDTVYSFYRDPGCTVFMHHAVDHGNICYMDHGDDGSSNAIKIGCRVDMENHLNHEVFIYESLDCSGTPAFGPHTAPFHGAPEGISPGECFPVDGGMYAMAHCSGKDPFRDAYGGHFLHFDHEQNKECHDRSIKTNRPKAHNFYPMGRCFSTEPGTSMFAADSCVSYGEVMLRRDETSETCENLGEPFLHKFEDRCHSVEDEHGNPNGYERQFCVDANTGPQK